MTDSSSRSGPATDTRRREQPFDAPTRTPRLLLRGPDEPPEDIDGAWWPRTDNLTTELHDLIFVLTPRYGATTRITFDWNALSVSQRGIDPPDGVDIEGALPGQPTGVMYVFGLDDRRRCLRVVDPATELEHADAQFRKAAGTTGDRSN